MPKGQTDKTTSGVQKILNEYGRPPLAGTPLAKEKLSTSPDILLAMVMDAMIKSHPISHDLSQKAINHLIEVGYHDIQKLSSSTWEERTMVLKEGGYNRYREQAATNLGALAEFVMDNYDGDLNKLLKIAREQRGKVRTLMMEIRGVGELAVEIFLNNAQSVWPAMAPFLDERSLKTAEEIGIGSDLDAIYNAVQRDPVQMSWFANGLSMVRLEKRQKSLDI